MDEREQAEVMERAIANMLPVQRQTIAEAALAGCTFSGYLVTRRLGQSEQYRKVQTLSYFAALPSGEWVEEPGGGIARSFDDVYEAACACLVELNRLPLAELVGFKLDEGNEQ